MVCGDKLMDKDLLIEQQKENIEKLQLKCAALTNALEAQKLANEKLVACKAIPPWFRDRDYNLKA